MIYADERGNEFGLPKYTVALAEAFEDAARNAPVKERTDARFVLMKKCLGADYVCGRCGGRTAQSVDVAELDLLFEDVRDAYGSASRSASVEKVVAEIAKLAPAIETMERAASIEGRLSSRNGFKRVY